MIYIYQMAVFGAGFGVLALLICLVWKLNLKWSLYVILFAAYIGALLAFAFFHGVLQEYEYNLIPFITVFKTGAKIRHIVQMLVNIAMFIPFGVFLNLAGTDKRKSVLTGLIMSLGIEAFQLILMRGVFDVDDLIMNTVGTFAGFWLFEWIKRILSNKYFLENDGEGLK